MLYGSLDLPSLPLSLLPIPTQRVLSPESVVAPSAGASPDLSREGPFDPNRDTSVSGAAPLVLDNLPECQYRMTSYDGAPATNADPGYRLQLHNPRFLEYVGAPESARLLSRSPGHWLHHMNHDEAVSDALQFQHDAGLMMTNLQILSQFVTSLNRMSSDVMRLAFGWEQYPADAMQAVSPSPRVRRAAHYMTGMGLWRPTDGPDSPGSLPVSSCNDCMMCPFALLVFVCDSVAGLRFGLYSGLLLGAPVIFTVCICCRSYTGQLFSTSGSRVISG